MPKSHNPLNLDLVVEPEFNLSRVYFRSIHCGIWFNMGRQNYQENVHYDFTSKIEMKSKKYVKEMEQDTH